MSCPEFWFSTSSDLIEEYWFDSKYKSIFETLQNAAEFKVYTPQLR